MIPSCQFPTEWEGTSMKYFASPGKLAQHPHLTGNPARTDAEMSGQEPNDTLPPIPHRMGRNKCEILPIPRKISSTPLLDTHPTGNLVGTDTEMSSQEPNDTLLPSPCRMGRNKHEIHPIPRKITHQISLKRQGDNGMLWPNMGSDQPQKMTPQQVKLALHPSSYSLAIYDSTNPAVESSYIIILQY